MVQQDTMACRKLLQSSSKKKAPTKLLSMHCGCLVLSARISIILSQRGDLVFSIQFGVFSAYVNMQFQSREIWKAYVAVLDLNDTLKTSLGM